MAGDWLITVCRHDNRRGYGGVVMTTLLTTAGRVRRRFDSSFSASPSPAAEVPPLTSPVLTALQIAESS